MALRYWVDPAGGLWDGAAGSKWATTSGGIGGASVPTSADDVIFDANSGSATVTVSGGRACKSFTRSGFTGTFAGFGSLTIHGGMSVDNVGNHTHTGELFFVGSGSDAIQLDRSLPNNFYFGFTGTLQLLSNLNFTKDQQSAYVSGTLDLNDFDLRCHSLNSNSSSARTILNATGNWEFFGDPGGGDILIINTENLTFDASDLTIKFNNTSLSVDSGAINLQYSSWDFGRVEFNHDPNYYLLLAGGGSYGYPANIETPVITPGCKVAFWGGETFQIGNMAAVGDGSNMIDIKSYALDLGSVLDSAIGNAGSDYEENDQLQIDAGNFNCYITILTVDSGGEVLTYQIDSIGSGYSVSNGNTSQNISGSFNGSGFELDILEVSVLEAAILNSSNQQSLDFINFENITGTGGPWYAGANSVDVGGNTGLIFADAPAPIPGYPTAANFQEYGSDDGDSEGGVIDETNQITAGANNLFPDIDAGQSASGVTLYRKIYRGFEDALYDENYGMGGHLDTIKSFIQKQPEGAALSIGLSFSGWFEAAGIYDAADNDEAQGNMVELSTNAKIELVSTGSDTRDAIIVGLNQRGQSIFEEVTLNGTTPVLTTKTFSKVFGIALSATNSETVTAKQGAGGSTIGTIGSGKNCCWLWMGKMVSGGSIVDAEGGQCSSENNAIQHGLITLNTDNPIPNGLALWLRYSVPAGVAAFPVSTSQVRTKGALYIQ